MFRVLRGRLRRMRIRPHELKDWYCHSMDHDVPRRISYECHVVLSGIWRLPKILLVRVGMIPADNSAKNQPTVSYPNWGGNALDKALQELAFRERAERVTADRELDCEAKNDSVE